MSISRTAIGDVLQHVLPKIKSNRASRGDANRNAKTKPFILGLSGMQGSGKSTWAKALAEALQEKHHLEVAVLSLDDLYHTHEKLVKIREENPSNELFRNRGQPGTHDEVLAEQLFDALFAGREVAIPSFDKSAYNGEGDRAPSSQWERIVPDSLPDILIFEGWCVGFQALLESEVEEKWSVSRNSNLDASNMEYPTTIMRHHPINHLKVINRNLKRYNDTFLSPSKFDYLVHLDTRNLANVYRWRIQQEDALRQERGTGMTNHEVVAFVKVYMPAYELYLEKLQKEAFISRPEGQSAKTQLRVLLDEGRQVIAMEEI
jgi:D-glycerate 3-kinase